MEKERQTEIDLKLHEFGQRMRTAWDARQADFKKNIAAFREGVKEDWQLEQTRKQSEPTISPPEKEDRAKDVGEPER